MAHTAKHPYKNDEYSITPLEADKMLRDWEYGHNRNIQPKAVRELIAIMNDGCIIIQPIIILYVRSTKKYVVVDGQHRLTAISKRGKSFNQNIQINEVDNINDIHLNFACIDRTGFRPPATSIDPEVRGKYGFSQSDIQRVCSAGFAVESGYSSSNWPSTNMTKLRQACYLRYEDAAKKFFDVVRSYRGSRTICCTWVMAVALPTIANPSTEKAALAFWEDVANAGRLGIPEAGMLYDLLHPPVSSKGKKEKIWEGRDAKDDGVRKVAAYWNAYASHRKFSTTIKKLKSGGAFYLHGVDDRYYVTIGELAAIHATKTSTKPSSVMLSVVT